MFLDKKHELTFELRKNILLYDLIKKQTFALTVVPQPLNVFKIFPKYFLNCFWVLFD